MKRVKEMALKGNLREKMLTLSIFLKCIKQLKFVIIFILIKRYTLSTAYELVVAHDILIFQIY